MSDAVKETVGDTVRRAATTVHATVRRRPIASLAVTAGFFVLLGIGLVSLVLLGLGALTGLGALGLFLLDVEDRRHRR